MWYPEQPLALLLSAHHELVLHRCSFNYDGRRPTDEAPLFADSLPLARATVLDYSPFLVVSSDKSILENTTFKTELSPFGALWMACPLLLEVQ